MQFNSMSAFRSSWFTDTTLDCGDVGALPCVCGQQYVDSPPLPLHPLPSLPLLSPPLPPLLSQPPKHHHRLLCFYFTNRRKPRLILRPVEVVYPRPRIFVFRDLLSEPEMARLRELAQPLVRKKGVGQMGQGGVSGVIWGGTGQVTWDRWGQGCVGV